MNGAYDILFGKGYASHMKIRANTLKLPVALSRFALSKKQVFVSGGVLMGVVVGGLLYNSLQVEATSTVPVTGYATVLSTGERLEFDASHGATVTIDNYTRQMDGYAWSEDIGWVGFGETDNPSGSVTAAPDGSLGAGAQALNLGQIDFGGSGSTASVSSDSFHGYAWSEDLGWIDFSEVKAIGYDPDLTAPTNAGAIALKKSSSGVSVAEGDWTNTNGYFSWQAGKDNTNGSGVLGYCLYVGPDQSGDPRTTKGLLGTSPVETGGACQYAVSGEHVDLTIGGALATAMTTSDDPYYLNIRAIDHSKNVYDGALESFSFRYDDTPPTNPSFINAPSQFLASKTVTMLWPATGSDAAQDGNSGVKGLQYKISNGPWYGAGHSGTQDITDLLDNNGTYTTVDPYDFDQLQEGNNIISFRTYDEAGNISNDIITTVIKINTDAPSSPQNLSATPSSSTQNNFAFSWQVPAVYKGTASSLVYCYTVNVVPTASNCTFTAPGVTSLAAGAFATQPGENTLYVVARDEAGNINYEVATSVKFTANTAAPGMPLNLDIADISVKASASWKLALSWDVPASVGSGVAKYKILRSLDGVAFSEVASTSGTSYVDGELSQQEYFYRVQACDSANNCGVQSSSVSKVPTGRFTSPAILTTGPSVTVKTRSATIAWVTDRDSDSRVQFGTTSGQYFAAEAAQSAQVKNHSIELNNLQPDTVYYYKARWTDSDGNTGSTSEMMFKTLPAPSVKNVSVGRVNLSSATVSLTSKQAAKVKIYYGLSEGFGGVEQINTSTAESSYMVELTGLSDGSTYYYKVNTVDAEGYEYDSGRIDTFTTPARPRISNVQFQPVDGKPTSTQKITWQTNVPATSLLNYRTNGQPMREMSDSKMTTEHSMTVEGLYDDSVYTVVVQSRDGFGNVAVSDEHNFKTALDTRPPEISKLRVEVSIRGVGNEARGQMIVSWTTDEPSTSQVSYSKGTSGSHYASSTAEDNALTTEHTVVISDLDTSQAYRLKAVSRDKARNTGESGDRSAIIGQPSDSVIDIILGTLEKIFGL